MVGRLRNPYKQLEKLIGYSFRKRSLMEAALTHRSFRFENEGVEDDNQRLEFLGDAVLGLATAAYLYDKHEDKNEGALTSFRSQTTSGKALASVARSIGLGDHIRIGRGEEQSGGRKRSSNLCDALEAILGAAYLDGGMKAVGKIFAKLFIPQLDNLSGDVWADNPKGRLQEYAQRRWKRSPQYRVIRADGPAHAAVFTVEATVAGHLRETGKARNKQDAESRAATALLERLNRRDRMPNVDL